MFVLSSLTYHKISKNIWKKTYKISTFCRKTPAWCRCFVSSAARHAPDRTHTFAKIVKIMGQPWKHHRFFNHKNVGKTSWIFMFDHACLQDWSTVTLIHLWFPLVKQNSKRTSDDDLDELGSHDFGGTNHPSFMASSCRSQMAEFASYPLVN